MDHVSRLRWYKFFLPGKINATHGFCQKTGATAYCSKECLASDVQHKAKKWCRGKPTKEDSVRMMKRAGLQTNTKLVTWKGEQIVNWPLISPVPAGFPPLPHCVRPANNPQKDLEAYMIAATCK